MWVIHFLRLDAFHLMHKWQALCWGFIRTTHWSCRDETALKKTAAWFPFKVFAAEFVCLEYILNSMSASLCFLNVESYAWVFPVSGFLCAFRNSEHPWCGQSCLQWYPWYLQQPASWFWYFSLLSAPTTAKCCHNSGSDSLGILHIHLALICISDLSL